MAREYLVVYGRAGHLGRFAAPADGFARGDRVVIRGRRGLELGDVLGPANVTIADDFVGELLRFVSPDDVDADKRASDRAAALAEAAEAVARQLNLSIAVLDCEAALDGRGAVLHALVPRGLDATPLLEALGERFKMIVRLYDMAAETPLPTDAADHLEEFKCDKPDCGEGECSDCGDGCSSCSAGGAKELEAYFAGLREQMEQAGRVPLV